MPNLKGLVIKTSIALLPKKPAEIIDQEVIPEHETFFWVEDVTEKSSKPVTASCF